MEPESHASLQPYRPIFIKPLESMLQSQLFRTLDDVKTNFKEHSYEISKPVAQLKQRLAVYLRNPPNVELFKEFFENVSIFFLHLSNSASHWISLIHQEEITSQVSVIDLGKYLWLVRNRMLQEGSKTCKLIYFFEQILKDHIMGFLIIIAEQIVLCYETSRQLIIQNIDHLNSATKEIRLINKYMIYKLLRQLSKTCFEKVQQQLNNSVLRNSGKNIMSIFTKYCVEKYEVVRLICHDIVKQKPIPKQSLEQQLVEKLFANNLSQNIKCRQVSDETGKRGILISKDNGNEETWNEESPEYLIRVDDDGQNIEMIDVETLQRKWSFNASRASVGIEQLVKDKKTLVENLRGAPTKIQKAAVESSVSTVGGSLGSCLANINEYDSFGSFVVDFSSKTAVTGSINYLVETIPIMGLFLVAGGFTYTFYKVLKSKFKTTNKKIQQLAAMALDHGTSIGAGVVGGIVGEILIPIPIVGLFVGSVIGGLLGNLGKDVIMKYLESGRFQTLAKYLDKHIRVEGCWEATDQLLEALGVRRESFIKSVPKSLQNYVDAQNRWATIVCFCLLSFHISQKDRERMKEEMKEDTKKDQDLASMQENVQKHISQNLEMAIHYLDENKIMLQYCLPEIQNFLQKMFSGSV